jgi:hypothetical protein
VTDYHRIAAVAACSAFLRAAIYFGWERYKAKKAKDPVPLRLRNGVYEPWGFAERSAWWWRRIGEVALIYFALLAGMLILGIHPL